MVYQQENQNSFASNRSTITASTATSDYCSQTIVSSPTNRDTIMTDAPCSKQVLQRVIMPHHPQRFIIGHGGVSGSHSMGIKTPTKCMKKKRHHGASSLGRNNASIRASKVAFYVAPPRLHQYRPRARSHRHHSLIPSSILQCTNDTPIMNENRLDFLLELPYELSVHILSYLDVFSLVELSCVSRYWHTLCRTKDVWRRRVMERQWQPSASSLAASMELDWFYIYQQRHQLDRRWMNGKVSTHYLMGHRDSVYCLEFDHQKIITGSRDRTIKVWDATSYQCIRTLHGHRASVLCLQFNDNIMVSGSSDKTLLVWDIKTLELLTVLQGHSGGVLGVSLNDRYIVSCSKDATIRIWDIHTFALLRTIQAHHGPVNAVQLHGDTVVSASGDTLVKMWDVKTGALIREFAGHTRGLACVQYEGKRIISGSNDRTIKVWNAETGECTMTLEGHADLVRTFDFNDNLIVSASYDLSVRVWDIRSGACLLNFQSGHTSWILDVHFDKTKIISASQDHSVLVMDFAQGLDTRFL